MRFAIAHKTATYLLVGFAYLAMIAGAGAPPLIARSPAGSGSSARGGGSHRS